ncbi:hypothetical protein B0H16DRAFT_1895858 [Mycena metata]|uniref:Uncharacterized protein n=1 Tax=Mycena metata TaxID=1033252 RepID=A0AAD7HL93_9AGAR|nr:hypothetical protein B0H16DRAFT_1895858 [Mycena metata]
MFGRELNVKMGHLWEPVRAKQPEKHVKARLDYRTRGAASYPFLVVYLQHPGLRLLPVRLKLQGFDGPATIQVGGRGPTYDTPGERSTVSAAFVGETLRELVGTWRYDVLHTMTFEQRLNNAGQLEPSIVDLLTLAVLSAQWDHTWEGFPDSLKDVFETRLKPAEVLPTQFDSIQHDINKILCTLLPEETEDSTPEGFFSRKWDAKDMGRLKDHLRKHSLDSSSGEDQTTYAELLEIPNEDLAHLCNQCTALGDAPTIWLMSALVGILKRLKPHDNPDSYRLIALESCFLKALTILIHWRIFDWAEARGLIPPGQNGFRPGVPHE